jgi:hypothetical protein
VSEIARYNIDKEGNLLEDNKNGYVCRYDDVTNLYTDIEHMKDVLKKCYKEFNRIEGLDSPESVYISDDAYCGIELILGDELNEM